MVFSIFWGIPSQQGSLSSLRSVAHRLNVDKKVKVFNVGDEFLMHTFKAHLLAAIMNYLNMNDTTDNLTHPCSPSWLRQLAEKLVRKLWHPHLHLTSFKTCTSRLFMWHMNM